MWDIEPGTEDMRLVWSDWHGNHALNKYMWCINLGIDSIQPRVCFQLLFCFYDFFFWETIFAFMIDHGRITMILQ